MPQSYARIAVHLIFSTKHRQPLITDAIHGELNAYLIGILRNLDYPFARTQPKITPTPFSFSHARTRWTSSLNN